MNGVPMADLLGLPARRAPGGRSRCGGGCARGAAASAAAGEVVLVEFGLLAHDLVHRRLVLHALVAGELARLGGEVAGVLDDADGAVLADDGRRLARLAARGTGRRAPVGDALEEL